MMSFEMFIRTLEGSLKLHKAFKGVAPLSSDIVEHSFLSFLGYKYKPEKCRFEVNLEKKSISFFFSEPYRIFKKHFVEDLTDCVNKKDPSNKYIVIQELDPNASAESFTVNLEVDGDFFVETSELEEVGDLLVNKSEAFLKHVKGLLDDPEKYDLYRYWSGYVKQNQNSITPPFSILSIANQINFSTPQFFSEAVWTAIIREITGNKELEVLSNPDYFLLENAYQIKFHCKDKSGLRTLDFPVCVIVDNIRREGLTKFLSAAEFILPPGVQAFVEKTIYRSFAFEADGNFRIDLGYRPELKEGLEKFGIKVLRPYQPATDEVGGLRKYYVFDKKDYAKTVLACAEMLGKNCLE